MENKTLETMTVKELREESKKRELTLEYRGHKFTKQELIERIMNYDAEQKDVLDDIQKAIDEAGEQPESKTSDVTDVTETNKNKSKELEEKPEDYICFAKTLEEIEKKYSGRKKQVIYDNELKVGSFVVFVHYVEAKNGNVYKKLRTAKVIGVNRVKELVRIITLLGTEKELGFEDLLYIRGARKECSYPKDIVTFLRGQRTEKGKALMDEKLAENNGSN